MFLHILFEISTRICLLISQITNVSVMLERVQQEKPALMVREDILDPLVPPESKVFQVLVEKKEQR